MRKNPVSIILMLSAFLASAALAAENPAESRLNELADRLIAGAGLSGRPAVAVLPFENHSSASPRAGAGIAEYLITVLRANAAIELVDRVNFGKAMHELALSQSGAIAEDKTLEVGRTVAAKYLVIGTVTDALGKVVVNGRMLETETGRIASTATVNLAAEGMNDMTREIFGEKTQLSATLFRSALIPGWGQFYTAHRVRGGISFGAFIAGLGATGYSFVLALQASDRYTTFYDESQTNSGQQKLIEEWFGPGVTRTSPSFDQARYNRLWTQRESDLWNRYASWKRNSLLWLAVTGGVWSLNLVDAAFAGKNARKKVELYFSVAPERSAELCLKGAF